MSAAAREALLQLKGVSIQFGGLKVIENLNLQVFKGELLGLIGPNGAGKTTAFNLISGVYQPSAGEIHFENARIDGVKTYSIAQKGIVRTFQNIRLFKELNVLTNIMVAMHPHCQYGLSGSLVKSKRFLSQEIEFRKEALDLLKIFDLQSYAEAEAGSLPYGVQRKLEIVRALASHPKLLLLDEPAAGMNHSETSELMNLIQKIRKQFQVTVLLIEHDMKLVMGICERIVVLDHGCVIAEGNATAIQGNPKVIEAYLGVEEGMSKALLSVKDLVVRYGAIDAVKGISFEVQPGEIVALIGANGAGKTTTLRAVSAILPFQGTISFDGENLTDAPPNKLVERGLIHTPEGRGIFFNLTVKENLELGAYLRSDKAAIEKEMEHCFVLFPRLKERLYAAAGTLSGGEQQMLAISRSLLSRPKLLMLDEPSLGLAPRIVQQIFSIITQLNHDEKMTILLVEQNARMALKISHRAYVMETGKITLQGQGKELLNHPDVQSAYLGG